MLYGERYNDLEKHICSIKDNDIHFEHFHPCAVLTTDHVSNTSALFDLCDIKYISQLKRCLIDTYKNEDIDTVQQIFNPSFESNKNSFHWFHNVVCIHKT